MEEQNTTIVDIFTDAENLDLLDKQIVNQLLAQPSITDSEIAKVLGISRQTVNRRRNSEAVRSRLCDILAISEKRVRRLVALSLNQMEVFLTDPDPRLRMASALAMLKLGSSLITPTRSSLEFSLGCEEEKLSEWVKDET